MLTACGGSGDSSGSNNPDSGSGTDKGGVGKGSAKEPIATPKKFQESPQLKSLVDAGSLPPVEERLPEEPYVVPHNWVQQGKYGGNLKLNITATSGGDSSSVGELWYSFGMLRFINDGQDIAPGVISKWTANADTSEWNFTLRKGLKWSDGKPVTTDDVIFWWKYWVNYADAAQSVPDECRSGKGTICKLTATDDLTFKMVFDAPAPLTADRLAMWTNGPGGNGPVWIIPAHYAKQFHPAFTKVPASWAGVGGLWEQNVNYKRSTKMPTLTPFKLVKYSEGRSLQWARNPYAYEVTKDGDQLPYIDTVTMTAVVDPQVGKVQITAGKVDYVQGGFNGLILADVSTLMKNKDKGGFDVYLWDSGSGTGSIFFLSQDYYDKQYRELFQKKEFRQALSLGFDRETAKKAIYFQTGEVTTGTLSPKAAEYLVNDTGKQAYTSWRDSFIKFDPDQANKLLDGLGLKKGSDGFRTFASGDKLQLRIDRPATASDEHVAKDNQLARDWKNIGINLKINPVPPTSFDDNWKAGKYMAHSAWEVGDGPNHLLYPQWMLPMEFSRWSPLQGSMYNAKGTKAYTSEADVDPWKRHPPRIMPEKGGPIAKLWDIYDTSKLEPDETKRTSLVWDMIKIHVSDGPYFQGTVANYPQIVVKNKDLKNVPTHDQLALGGFVNPWIHPTPAVYDIETYYWDNPDNHS